MANAETQAPAAAPAGDKKKRKAFTRSATTVFMLIGYTDEDGNPVALNADRLTVTVERDPKTVVKMLTGAEGTGGRTVKSVELPTAAKPTPAA